jgi:hypothetical protein
MPLRCCEVRWVVCCAFFLADFRVSAPRPFPERWRGTAADFF